MTRSTSSTKFDSPSPSVRSGATPSTVSRAGLWASLDAPTRRTSASASTRGNPKGYSPRVAGRAFESMRLVTIWHDEPGGADSGTVCSYAAAKRHPQHWTLQWRHWQKIRRTLFTRCEWCGGPSRTGDWVNISHQWYSPRPEHFWQSPRGVYHDDCSSIDRAHKTCLCGVGPWANGDYGKCEECGKFRAWKSKADAFHPGDEPLRLLASIPEGQRDRSKYAKASRMWRDYHEARRVAERLREPIA